MVVVGESEAEVEWQAQAVELDTVSSSFSASSSLLPSFLSPSLTFAV